MHLAKYSVKETTIYTYKNIVGVVDLNKNPYRAELTEFIKSKSYIKLKNKLGIVREEIGKPNLLVVLHEVTDTPYEEKGSLKNASKEVKGPFSEIITEIKRSSSLQQRRDLINFVMPYVIMDNLPKEALLANQEIETLEILNDPAVKYKVSEKNQTPLPIERLVIQMVEASAMNLCESYFRSLGEVEIIERSRLGDYKIVYKDGKEVHIECKTCIEQEANKISKKVDEEQLKKGTFYRAWVDTINGTFTLTQFFGAGKEEQIDVFKIKDVQKYRNRLLK